MHVDKQAGKVVRWLAVTGMAALATALLELLHARSTAAGMVYLVLVVWTATRAGTALSLYMAAICSMAFAFLFLAPFHDFGLEGGEQWVAMAAFMASCLVVSRVAKQARQQAKEARRRQADVERFFALSQEMMLQGDADGLIRALPALITRIFDLETVVIFVRDRNRSYSSSQSVLANVEAGLRALMQGNSLVGELAEGYYASPLMLGMRSVGAFAWKPAKLSREVASAVSAQVALALARAITMETSARMEAAREVDRLRTALIDSITHELRTPLTSIRAASTTLLGAGGLDAALRLDMAKIIDEESARLDELIRQSVEMAEIDANVLEARLEAQHPKAFLEEAVEQSRDTLARHRVTIEADEPDEPTWFDAHLMSRVLRHLLENAASYTPVGTRIKLTSRRANQRLEFTVEDEGPGIEPSDLPLIFDKSYRGRHGAETRKGSGMGLAIARAILAAHGGSIVATSAPGSGACFRCWVPLVDKAPEAGRREAASISESEVESVPQPEPQRE